MKSFINNDNYQYSTAEECLEYFNDKDSIAIDTETKGKDWNIKKLLKLQINLNSSGSTAAILKKNSSVIILDMFERHKTKTFSFLLTVKAAVEVA